MKAKDIKQQTKEELQKSLTDMVKELNSLNLRKNVGQVENTAHIRLVRRNIARVRTFLSQK